MWVLFAGAFVNRLGTFVLPFITLYLPPRILGATGRPGLAAYGAGAIGAQGVGGLLADRLGRLTPSRCPCSAARALTLSLVWVEHTVPIVAVAMLLGFTAELYPPASSALLTDLIEPEARVAAFSAYRLA